MRAITIVTMIEVDSKKNPKLVRECETKMSILENQGVGLVINTKGHKGHSQ